MEPKDEIKARLDIAEVIQGYIELKPAGMRGFKAVCPFHNEKSPSFHVSTEKQIWHCFGCQKGGDIFSFVMEMEGMDFLEALKLLAGKAGVELPERRQSKSKKKLGHVYELQELASKYYEAVLHKTDAGNVALKYLEDRGITSELIQKFRLGYALDKWSGFIEFAGKRGITPDRLQKAGLAKQKRSGQGYIDQFRDRIMIPINDGQGRITGFTARLLKSDDNAPKYLNTPETEIFQKREALYGLHLAKTSIRLQNAVIIVEGNLDVIASHKAGVEHVVASSGTALTELQIATLKRLTSNIIFAFDADSAGFNAAARGINIARNLGMNVSVIQIPKDAGSDPDDVVQKDPGMWQEIAKKTVSIMDFYFQHAVDVYDTASPKGKRDASEFLLKEMVFIENVVEREHWLQRLSDLVRVPVDVLRRTLPSVNRQNSTSAPAKIQPSVQAPKSDKYDKASARIVGLFIAVDDLRSHIAERITDESGMPSPWQEIYKKLHTVYTAPRDINSEQKHIFQDYTSLIAYLGDDHANLVRESMVAAEEALEVGTIESLRTDIDHYARILHEKDDAQARRDLEARIRQAEAQGDHEQLSALMQQYQVLISKQT